MHNREVTNPSKWYVLQTRSNHEHRARDYLDKGRIDVFLPLYRVASRRRDRKITVEIPLFKGYIFIRNNLVEYLERIHILRAPGAVGIVSFAGTPAQLDPGIIESIRTLVKSGRDPKPFPFLETGAQIRVVGGPLAP